jgi:hypothetical protein
MTVAPPVYFVRIGKHIKIGTINNLSRRLGEFRTASAEEITCTSNNARSRDTERRLHALFKEERLKLEFFRAEWICANSFTLQKNAALRGLSTTLGI